ncbi:MAG: DUF1415 domain-containing protein [Bacteroidota bacterium]
MLETDSHTYIERSQRWVESVVIGLNLCPFAARVSRAGQIRYQLSQAKESEELLEELNRELDHLLTVSPEETDTTVLIHPHVLNDFLDYWDFIEITEALLAEKELEGIIQIATFHPAYQFEGTEADSAENYSNRSPYPMLHLLREDSMSVAIDSHPDPEGIPDENVERLRGLGREYLTQLRDEVMK